MNMYSQDEEKRIVKYLVEKEVIHRIKGDAVWKELEAEMVVNRTWQSLKQHFRKKIIFEIHYPRYGLDKETIQLFRDHFYKETKKMKSSELRKDPVATSNTGRKLASFLDRSSSSSSSGDSDSET